MRDKKSLDLDNNVSGNELGGVEGQQTIMKIYYVSKKINFSKHKKDKIAFQICHIYSSRSRVRKNNR